MKAAIIIAKESVLVTTITVCHVYLLQLLYVMCTCYSYCMSCVLVTVTVCHVYLLQLLYVMCTCYNYCMSCVLVTITVCHVYLLQLLCHVYLQIEYKKKHSFCVVPKMEYLPEYGAQCLTPSELTRQWMSLYVRPGTDLYRGRLICSVN
jgi:hypothetical protein